MPLHDSILFRPLSICLMSKNNFYPRYFFFFLAIVILMENQLGMLFQNKFATLCLASLLGLYIGSKRGEQQ